MLIAIINFERIIMTRIKVHMKNFMLLNNKDIN